MKRALVRLSIAFLRGYFADGKEHQPADFDDDIIGGFDADAMFGVPRWNQTPFRPALSRLVKNGEIRAWRAADGWHYRATGKLKAA